MPSKKRIWQSILREYLTECEQGQLDEKTRNKYEERLTVMLELMEASGRPTNPKKMTKEDIAFLVQSFKGEVSYRKYRVAVLSGFLVWAGNPALKHLHLKWPSDTRPNADWLEPGDAERLKAILADPREQIIIHLEMDLGLRRVEVSRLKVGDIGKKYVEVLGKGRMGGKPRRVSVFPEQTHRILAAYMDWRQAEILKMHMKFKDFVEPKSLLIGFDKRRRVIPANEQAITTVVKKISRRAGTNFSSHTLRRTWGR
jgi:integrase/recombinase XerD